MTWDEFENCLVFLLYVAALQARKRAGVSMQDITPLRGMLAERGWTL